MCKNYPRAQELLDDVYQVDQGNMMLPIDVERICKFLHINIEKVNSSSDDFVGKVSRDQDNKGVITLNMLHNEYEPRRRFTIAHEIGHFCLHLRAYMNQSYIDSSETMFRKEDVWNRDEQEANAFAAELLMPEALIRPEINRIIETNGTADEAGKKTIKVVDLLPIISDVFVVSSQAMEYRLRKLKIIT